MMARTSTITTTISSAQGNNVVEQIRQRASLFLQNDEGNGMVPADFFDGAGGTNEDINSGLINALNSRNMSQEARVALMRSLSRGGDQAPLAPIFGGIIRNLDPAVAAQIYEALQIPLDNAIAFGPVRSIIAMGFALGFADTSGIVQEVLRNLQIAPETDYSGLVRQTEDLTEERVEKADEESKSRREENEDNNRRATSERQSMLGRFRSRTIWRGLSLTALAGSAYFFGPTLLSTPWIGSLIGMLTPGSRSSDTRSNVHNSLTSLNLPSPSPGGEGSEGLWTKIIRTILKHITNDDNNK